MQTWWFFAGGKSEDGMEEFGNGGLALGSWRLKTGAIQSYDFKI